MTSTSILLLLVNLQKDLRKTLTSEALKKSYDSIFQQTYALQPPAELIKGFTPERNLAVLKTALENFETEHQTGLLTPWVFSTLKFAEQLIKLKAKDAPKVPPATSISTGTDKQKSTANTNESSRNGSKSTDKLVRLPSATKREKIYDTLEKKVNSGTPFLTGNHITCKDATCTYCKSLFLSVRLTRCTHKACAPNGWYPHVGVRLWHDLQRHHKSGAVFTAKNTTMKKNELPSILDYKSSKPTDVEMIAKSSSSSSKTTSTVTSVSTTYTPSIRSRTSSSRRSTSRSTSTRSTPSSSQMTPRQKRARPDNEMSWYEETCRESSTPPPCS